MNSFFEWIRAVFSDSRGEPSSKRTISIIAFMLLGGAFILNLFLDFTIDEFMWDGMITLVIFGIGFVASEKFSGILRKGDPDDHRRGGGGYRGGGYNPGGYNPGGYRPGGYRDDRRDDRRDDKKIGDKKGTDEDGIIEEENVPPMDTENYEDV